VKKATKKNGGRSDADRGERKRKVEAEFEGKRYKPFIGEEHGKEVGHVEVRKNGEEGRKHSPSRFGGQKRKRG